MQKQENYRLMQIVYHLGAHCTDDERLLRCLLRNREALAAHGITIPGPARYRTLIRDTAATLQKNLAAYDTQESVLDQINDSGDTQRMVLSWENFLSFPQWVLRGRLYPAAGDRLRSFTRIFPDHGSEFHLAIRNPATLLPALFQKQRGKTAEDFIGTMDVRGLLWSETISDILSFNPGVPLTVWCDEDTPLIWPEVIAAVSGHPAGMPIEGDDELLAMIMQEEGLQRLRKRLNEDTPPVEERRAITAGLLDEFARSEAVEIEVEMPGWTPDLVQDLTDRYEQDISRIMAMPGVNFITP